MRGKGEGKERERREKDVTYYLLKGEEVVLVARVWAEVVFRKVGKKRKGEGR